MERYVLVSVSTGFGSYGVLDLKDGKLARFSTFENAKKSLEFIEKQGMLASGYSFVDACAYAIDIESERKKHGWVTKEENVSEIQLYPGCWVETDGGEVYGPIHFGDREVKPPGGLPASFQYWARRGAGWQYWNASGETGYSRELGLYVAKVYASDPRQNTPEPIVKTVVRKSIEHDGIEAKCHDLTDGLWTLRENSASDGYCFHVDKVDAIIAVLNKIKEESNV